MIACGITVVVIGVAILVAAAAPSLLFRLTASAARWSECSLGFYRHLSSIAEVNEEAAGEREAAEGTAAGATAREDGD